MCTAASASVCVAAEDVAANNSFDIGDPGLGGAAGPTSFAPEAVAGADGIAQNTMTLP
jgi:hypothetical protein